MGKEENSDVLADGSIEVSAVIRQRLRNFLEVLNSELASKESTLLKESSLADELEGVAMQNGRLRVASPAALVRTSIWL